MTKATSPLKMNATHKVFQLRIAMLLQGECSRAKRGCLDFYLIPASGGLWFILAF
jgi:hypothetical protein